MKVASAMVIDTICKRSGTSPGTANGARSAAAMRLSRTRGMAVTSQPISYLWRGSAWLKGSSLARDVVICLVAGLIGLWADGPRAALLLIATCGDLPFSVELQRHLIFMPVTSALMLVSCAACCGMRGGHGPSVAWLHWCGKVGLAYVLMMAIMMMSIVSMAGAAASPPTVLLASLIFASSIFPCLWRLLRAVAARRDLLSPRLGVRHRAPDIS